MDFGFSEEQDMLRQSVSEFLEAECPMTYVRQMMDDDRGFSEEQWDKMAQLGWTGLIVPEQYGGGGPVWPGDYSIDWGQVTELLRTVAIVDGKWDWTAAGLRTGETGSDAL